VKGYERSMTGSPDWDDRMTVNPIRREVLLAGKRSEKPIVGTHTDSFGGSWVMGYTRMTAPPISLKPTQVWTRSL
jgi:hypothetical protein